MAQQKALAVTDLKNALARIDRDNDGMINFNEFSRGLRDLGISLPEQEVRHIWSQAGSASTTTSSPPALQAQVAGIPTIKNEKTMSKKQLFPSEQRLCLVDHISDGFVAKDDAEICGITGKHSHKRTGYNAGNASDRMVGMETGISYSGATEVRRRKFLLPDQMSAIVEMVPPVRSDEPTISEAAIQALDKEKSISGIPKNGESESEKGRPRMRKVPQLEQINRAPYVHDEILDKAQANGLEPGESSSARRSKVEESVRVCLQSHRNAVEKAFATKGIGNGGTLRPHELKECLRNLGFAMGDVDFESVWRRADDSCLGQVSLSQLQQAFNLQTEPRGSLEQRNCDAAASSKFDGADHRSSLAVLSNKVRFLDTLKKVSGNRQVDMSDFRSALASSGCFLSDQDANRLFARAQKGGKVDVQTISESLKEIESLGDENKSILGFGTGLTLLKAGGPAGKHHGTFAPDDPAVRQLYMKIASSEIGNPRRLRQLFRKYDPDRSGHISRAEFTNGLVTHDVPLTREEREFLSQVVDVEGNGVVSYDSFVNIIAELTTTEEGLVSKRTEQRDRNRLEAPYAYDRPARDGAKEPPARPGTAAAGSRGQPAAAVRPELSGASLRSQRSNASVRSVSSTTSSFASGNADRSQWLSRPATAPGVRGGVGDGARGGGLPGAEQAQRSQAAPPQRDPGRNTPSTAAGPRIVHLAAPPLSFG